MERLIQIIRNARSDNRKFVELLLPSIELDGIVMFHRKQPSAQE